MKQRILISAFSNLYTDQRIEKSCQSLYEAGYQIHLIGNDWKENRQILRPYSWERIELKSKSLRGAYPEFNFKLYRKLNSLLKIGDLLYCNDLDALLPNYLLHKKFGNPIFFDSHEIFSQMPMLKGRITGKIWQTLEAWLVPKMNYMITESQSYADWFQKEYGVRARVVRNLPMRSDFRLRKENVTDSKFILYQGVLNPFRGLTELCKAMVLLPNYKLKIAGDGPLRLTLEALVKALKLNHQIEFLGNLHPEKLREVTRSASVGVSLEQNGGASYLYSLPNKIGDYIQAQVPIVMIDFPEMRRVYERFRVGEIIPNHHPETIARALKIVLEKGRQAYLPELERAADALCWEADEAILLDAVKQAIGERRFVTLHYDD